MRLQELWIDWIKHPFVHIYEVITIDSDYIEFTFGGLHVWDIVAMIIVAFMLLIMLVVVSDG